MGLTSSWPSCEDWTFAGRAPLNRHHRRTELLLRLTLERRVYVAVAPRRRDAVDAVMAAASSIHLHDLALLL